MAALRLPVELQQSYCSGEGNRDSDARSKTGASSPSDANKRAAELYRMAAKLSLGAVIESPELCPLLQRLQFADINVFVVQFVPELIQRTLSRADGGYGSFSVNFPGSGVHECWISLQQVNCIANELDLPVRSILEGIILHEAGHCIDSKICDAYGLAGEALAWGWGKTLLRVHSEALTLTDDEFKKIQRHCMG